ncbi:MAG TPA: ABC transporter permease subunit [Pseudonocardiaceae bacterium]|jgi:osmoprotectant transport system permease protein|nr:ABC transporter permease subunit [Pseudonocardiaceae bacterium]
MSWATHHWAEIWSLAETHIYLSLLPVLFGLVLSIPLGWLATRAAWLRGTFLSVSTVLYTIPSLALIVVMPIILGTNILDPLNMIVTLTIYTVALLVRSVADALAAVPEQVIAAATAMGYRPLRRFLTVELPLAIPVLVAGLRVATVSNISLASVGALIGLGGLGQLFTDGFERDFATEITVGIIACVVLAVVADVILVVLGRLATPWTRAVTR